MQEGIKKIWGNIIESTEKRHCEKVSYLCKVLSENLRRLAQLVRVRA